MTQHSDGRTSILFPVELDLRLNTDRLTGRSNPSLPSESPAPPQVAGHADNRIPTSSDVESVKIKRTNYAERNGYQPEFPGGSVRVPLPKVAGDRFGKPLKLRDGTTEIKYWNYSVVMNQDRRMAYFSAANIRTTEGKGTRDSGDFIEDERVREVDPNVQLTESFYKNNNFDQGHLTRRDDLQWGA
ncbi:MAG: DNA/RNA non-specific endonuclease, partial [Planctomyces sp.]